MMNDSERNSAAAPILPPTSSNDPSIIFATMHKAGSVIANSLFVRLLAEHGMAHVDLAGNAFHSGLKEWKYCVQHAELLQRHGYYFGAFRGAYVKKMGDFTGNRLIIQIRDPRDCIVSLYYSYRTSHGVPGEGTLKRIFDRIRHRTNELSVDEFALKNAISYSYRMNVIRLLMDRYPDHLLLRYEDMVTDFDGWLEQVTCYLNVTPTVETLAALKAEADFKITSEDESQHRRQVTPEDFRRKLSHETRVALTMKLAPCLEYFGYDGNP